MHKLMCCATSNLSAVHIYHVTLPLKLGQIEMDNQEGIIFDHFAIWKRKKIILFSIFIIYQIYVFQL